jgi:ribosomal protein L29
VKALEAREKELEGLAERERLLLQEVETLTSAKAELETAVEVSREVGRAQSSLNVTLTERREIAEKGCEEMEKKVAELKEVLAEMEAKKAAEMAADIAKREAERKAKETAPTPRHWRDSSCFLVLPRSAFRERSRSSPTT